MGLPFAACAVLADLWTSQCADDGGCSYAIAAYAIVLATLAGYGLHLVRQRRALRRELEGGLRGPDRVKNG